MAIGISVDDGFRLWHEEQRQSEYGSRYPVVSPHGELGFGTP
jgi:hypothetical protein